jgi:uncharacterized membrane protein YkoI
MKRAAFLLACALVASAPAWADVSRDEAAVRATQSVGGRGRSVDRAESGGRAVWRVKIVTPQGEVKVVLVDVASGRVL